MFLRGEWATDTFVTNYLPLALFPVLYVGARMYYREGVKQPHDMDFVSNIEEIEAATLESQAHSHLGLLHS